MINNYFRWSISNVIQPFESDESVIIQFEHILGLTYQGQPHHMQTNLCFIESDEVRPEYKTTFSFVDILNYVNAIRSSDKFKQDNTSKTSDAVSIMYPRDSDMFWKVVKLGNNLRKHDSSHDKILLEIIAAINMVLSES